MAHILWAVKELNIQRTSAILICYNYKRTNCAFGLYPSSGVSRTNKIEELKIIDHNTHVHKQITQGPILFVLETPDDG
jgi:hypothetical protein